MNETTKILPCPRLNCGRPAPVYTVAGREYRDLCPSCAAEEDAKEANIHREERFRKAEECWRILERRHPGYSPGKTVWARIMPELATVAAIFLEGSYAKKGLWISGPTNIGKTRVVFAIMHQLCELGNSPIFLNAVDFSEAATLAALGDLGARRKLAEFRHSPIAVLDDIGKGSITPRAAEALYRMAEGMRDREATLIVTSNTIPANIAAQMGDYGDPFRTRIGDLCGNPLLFSRVGRKE